MYVHAVKKQVELGYIFIDWTIFKKLFDLYINIWPNCMPQVFAISIFRIFAQNKSSESGIVGSPKLLLT